MSFLLCIQSFFAESRKKYFDTIDELYSHLKGSDCTVQAPEAAQEQLLLFELWWKAHGNLQTFGTNVHSKYKVIADGPEVVFEIMIETS